MDSLNYQHLRYFWEVAKEGNLTRASKRLRLAPSTVSAQIKALEEYFKRPLFQRHGRRLRLTEQGELVKSYADDIFSLGDELHEALRLRDNPTLLHRLRVGLGDGLSKLLAYQLLLPALQLEDYPVHLICEEDSPAHLANALSLHHLDIVLTDQPLRGTGSEQLFLGQCSISLFATEPLCKRYQDGWPQSINDAPLLFPDLNSVLRSPLETWLAEFKLSPQIIAELGDSTLLKVFGKEGIGLFPAPSLLAPELARHYSVYPVGEIPGEGERIYALFGAGRARNPAVQAIVMNAQQKLKSSGDS